MGINALIILLEIVETIIAATPIFVLNPVFKNSVTEITTESN